MSINSESDTKCVFVKSDHKSYLISRITSYFRQGFLCDIVFVCDQGQNRRRISAHRLIIAMLSDYFRNLIETNKPNEIVLNNIDADIFEKFIVYAYEGHIEIHSSDVIKILNVAYTFYINEIVEACSNFIKKQIQWSNCLGLYRLSLEYNLQDLTEIIWNYIVDHFSEVIENNHEFLELSFDEMKRILASDDINIESEEKVYEAFVSWLDYDLNRYNDNLAELFSLIRLPLIKRKYLTGHIDTNERFANNNACQMLIIEAMRYHLAPEKRLTMKSIRTKPRKATLGALYCFGGVDIQTIERYDFRTDSWQIDGHWNSRRTQFACIRLDNKLFVCGGRDGLKVLNSTEMYDFQTKTWTVGPPMLTNRYDFSIGSISGPLYAVGGHDGRVILNTIERFDPERLEWTFVTPMNDVRYTFGVAVLENRLYAVGGQDNDSSLREVEFFDPHTNRWSQCTSMIKSRANVAVVACNQFLYAIGGYEFSTVHDNVERYDLRCNQWTLITSLTRPKEALGSAVVEDKLYIVGGFDGKLLNEVEKYDPETNQWEKCSPLITKRAGASLIHLPNFIHQSSQGNKNHSIHSHQRNRFVLS